MTPHRLTLALAGAVCIVLFSTHSASAGLPPPPPTPSNCGPCGGPPPPPTLVPTAPPTVLPKPTPLISISVHLKPTKVRRGQRMTLTVSAIPGTVVAAVLRYHHAKAITYSGATGDSGTYKRSWKVSNKAALGRGSVTVVMKVSPKPYASVIDFTVRA